MTQRYILERRRRTAFRYPSNKRFPLMSASSLLCLRLSPSLLPLLSRVGSRLALSRLGAQLAPIQLPISRLRDADETFGVTRIHVAICVCHLSTRGQIRFRAIRMTSPKKYLRWKLASRNLEFFKNLAGKSSK